MTHTVCFLPGDGIGPEVTSAARQVIEATGVDIEWVNLPAGAAALEFCGNVLPERTIASIAGHGIALKGPVTTPIGRGYESVNVRLRTRLNLYAAIRPVCTLPGIKTRYDNMDLLIIRENTEGLCSCTENEIVTDVIQSLKVATATASTLIAHFAFDQAVQQGRKKVTVLHKADIMKKSHGLFLRCVRKAYAAYADRLGYEELIIDHGCAQLVKDPSQFDVLLLENFYGDIISNLVAGFVGGLGVVPGANIGKNVAIFEPVHGSALDIARKGIANPLACILSGAMMLDHLDENAAATKIRNACHQVLVEANPENLTRDIGGTGGTEQFTQAIIRAMT